MYSILRIGVWDVHGVVLRTRAATPSEPSLFHVSGIAGIADAARFYCPGCFNWKHSFWRAAKGFLAWHVVCRPWMRLSGYRSVPPLLATAGDWIYDTRSCGCGVPLIADDAEKATIGKPGGDEAASDGRLGTHCHSGTPLAASPPDRGL